MTFGAIKTRIADELVRPDLASQIALAVNDAIFEAAGNRFWFNEVRSLTLSTVIGQGYYTSADVSALTAIDAAYIVVSGQRRNLEAVNAHSIDQWLEGQSTLTGEPFAYARYGNGISLWMVPSIVVPLYIDGVTRFAPLVADVDTNPWLVEGERLIRALAKARLLEDVIRDFDEADRQWQMAERQRLQLRQQTGSRLSTDTLVPSW